jgi:hypothetical protein
VKAAIDNPTTERAEISLTASANPTWLGSMKKGYQGHELWSAVNPLTGKREHVDPEGELIPGETIIKLYYLI